MIDALKASVKGMLARLAYGRGNRAECSPHGSIVLFHRVNNEYRGDTLTVSTSAFAAYLRLFKAYFDLIPLDEFVTLVGNGSALEGTLSITFDDGYLDNYEHAAPLLERYKIPCTFFVTTEFVESQALPWWDEDLPSRPKWMTWEQVRQLHEAGFSIGSHTLTHPDLGKVTGVDAQKEIVKSKLILEERLGQTISLFSYPYGGLQQMAESNIELVRNAGYRACFSAHGGVVPAGTDVFRLQRHPISGYHKTPWMYLYELRRQHMLANHPDRQTYHRSLYRE